MITPDDSATIADTFSICARQFADRPFLAVPANPVRAYHPEGLELSYADVASAVRLLSKRYAEAGYGLGHRVSLLLENRPEHLLHKLAMNALGICCVPLNADHRPKEMAYVLDHAKVDLVIVVDALQPQLRAAMEAATHRPAVAVFDETAGAVSWPEAAAPAASTTPSADTPASVLYTSGTTGRPKGCVLSHRYELEAGRWYATAGGLASFHDGGDRIYNPLPLFHVNASIFSFYCAMLRGNCQVQTDRFSPARWWAEVTDSRATVVHYLGVVVPMLLGQPPGPLERAHRVRFAIGAGVDPQRHAEFEQRFGFPLVEIWGMTEMVRAIIDNEAPRQVGTRAFGRPRQGLEIRIVDDADAEVPDGTPGELLVRHSATTPRRDFFSGYLDDPSATEQAWRGGWFHTGDIVTRSGDGLMRFIDRRKNIIRRSGENIAAAEVEAVLQTHPWVEQAAVLSVPDDVREEEVLACVVLRAEGRQNFAAAAKALFAHCNAELSYYKAPGWLWITDSIPTTSTQKIQKHQIFEPGTDPRTLPGMIDLRPIHHAIALPVPEGPACAGHWFADVPGVIPVAGHRLVQGWCRGNLSARQRAAVRAVGRLAGCDRRRTGGAPRRISQCDRGTARDQSGGSQEQPALRARSGHRGATSRALRHHLPGPPGPGG
jgi:acyl-CoA synthetase (AMP-forming)/AMP-acid ligase II